MPFQHFQKAGKAPASAIKEQVDCKRQQTAEKNTADKKQDISF